MNHRIRGVYGGAWAKLIAGDYTPGPKVLDRLGRRLVEEVINEARKDLARRSQGTDTRVGLPDTEKFFQSFSYRVKGSVVEVMCNWPTIDALMEGRSPFPMTWLTRDKVPGPIPIHDPTGKIIFRMAPKNPGEAWIHPGFEKHNFVRRGIEKARAEMAVVLKDDLEAFLNGKRR
jgi:hypothetical protein